MFRFLKEFASERHADERVAMRWHIGHAVVYGVLILQYIGGIVWHLAAANRHRDAARKHDHVEIP